MLTPRTAAMSQFLTIQVVMIVTLSIVFTRNLSFSKTISVNALKGNDTECGKNNSAVPCQSLEMVEELLLQQEDSVRIEVETNLALHSAFQVVDSRNIHIVGTAQGDTLNLTCRSEGAGFIFDNVHNFSVVNLTVINCMASLEENQRPRFAMMIKSSSNVLLTNVSFVHCTNNTALVLINNTGEVLVHNTSFKENHQRKRAKVDISYPGAISIQQNSRDSEERVSYKITNSIFHYNKSPETWDITTIGNSTTPFVDRGYGGAVFAEFGGNISNCSLVIQDCRFIYNIAARGGGVYAYYKDNARYNFISIIRSEFSRNNADISGGAINLGHYNSPSLHNIFTITDCKICSNSALYGAGLTFYSIYGNTSSSSYRTLIVDNSEWEINYATLSSAVDVMLLKQNNGDREQGYLSTPEFNNCSFRNNIIQREKTNHDNVGTFVVSQMKVFFSKHTIFEGNRYSALLLEQATAEFQTGSMVNFTNNTGFNGGAISMYGFSTIILNPNSSFIFFKNYARNYGGAIFHKTGDQHAFLRGATDCFLRSNIPTMEKGLIETIKVAFNQNKADTGGHAMYSTSFRNCDSHCRKFLDEKHPHGQHSKQLNQSTIFKCVGNFSFDQNIDIDKPYYLTTSAWKFDFQDKKRCFKAIPGGRVNLKFKVVDDFNQDVKPLLAIAKENDNCTAQVNVTHKFFLSNKIHPTGVQGASANFTITAIGVREIYFSVKVTLLPCPPGFHNIHNIYNTCKCASGQKGYTEVVKCDNDNFQAEHRGNLWIGYIPDNNHSPENLYFSPCFGLLCNASNYRLSNKSSELNEKICVKNREGVMCGECTHRHSTYYHSRNLTCGPERHCYLGGLFYVLSEIMPMVAFFVVVVTFDLSFTSGSSVGFIFFTQYLNQLTVHINPVFSYLRSPYQIFYGLFNFEFFNVESMSFCLWKNAQIQDILAVKYLTISIALALVLIFVLILHNNSCSRLCRLRSRVSTRISVVNGLSAFLVICYAQCTRTTFYILRYTRPVGYGGIRASYYSYFGGLPYMDGKHLFYAIPALISLVVITILPPLVLLIYPLCLHLLSLCGLSEHRAVTTTLRVVGIYKLMPFIDSFQGCYKDRLRFFAGLYFVYRIAILLAFTVSANDLLFNIYSEIVLIALLGIHAVVQPYKRNIHNVLDSLVFLNLALINGCVIIVKEWIKQLDDQTKYNEDPSILILNAFQLVLLYAPMVVVFFYLGRCIHVYYRNRKSVARIQEVDDVLDHTSTNSTYPVTSTKSTPETVASNKSKDYGSLESTY